MKLCGCTGALSFPRSINDLKKFSYLTTSFTVCVPEGPALVDGAFGWCKPLERTGESSPQNQDLPFSLQSWDESSGIACGTLVECAGICSDTRAAGVREARLPRGKKGPVSSTTW